jgi:poly-gamma-glutamate capsule biosynthesis protein CapA/YwtB (metallophosphatase superfamily)
MKLSKKNIALIPLIILIIITSIVIFLFLKKKNFSLPQNELLRSGSNKNDPVSMAIAGDILLAKAIEQNVKIFGHEYLFRNVKNELANADISFANLEGPASFIGKPDNIKPADIRFRANPAMLFTLKNAGIDIVSLANNHATDYYEPALIETLELLDLLSIKHFGAGKNFIEAHKPALIEIRGQKLAFLGYADLLWRVKEAGKDSAGVALLKEDAVIKDIIFVKESYKPDHLIISLHWGDELYQKPRKEQIKLAHDLIDAGADFIIGHHPHVLQGIEMYKNKMIIYSMGNFLFDMYQEEAKESMILKINFDQYRIIDARIIPVLINTDKFQPELASEEKARKILTTLISLSKPLNTEIEIDSEKGTIGIVNVR